MINKQITALSKKVSFHTAHPKNDTFAPTQYIFTIKNVDYYIYSEDNHLGLGATYLDFEDGSYSAQPIQYYLNDILVKRRRATSNPILNLLFTLGILAISSKDKLIFNKEHYICWRRFHPSSFKERITYDTTS